MEAFEDGIEVWVGIEEELLLFMRLLLLPLLLLLLLLIEPVYGTIPSPPSGVPFDDVSGILTGLKPELRPEEP